jgi:ribosomal protein S7
MWTKENTTMNKLSSTKVAEVLAQVPIALRAQQDEISALKEKVAHYEKRDRVIKIASAMQAKNLDPETSYSDKIENLMGSNDLDVVEKAIEFSAPQIKLAALSDSPGNAGSAEDAFVAGLLD